MIQKPQEVADSLGDVVGLVCAILPVGLSNQQDNARSDADQERDRDPETHECRMPETTGSRCVGFTSGSGRRRLVAKTLRFDEAVRDHAVEEENHGERGGHNERERQPRSDIIQEELVLLL